MPVKKTFVLDTCVFLSDPNCLKQFEENDIIIPLKVLDEIEPIPEVHMSSSQIKSAGVEPG